MPDRAKQQLLLATKPEFDAYNAERVKAGKQPFDHEEYLATQFGYKAISRLINAHNETPLKGWWNDTKSLWKAKYGAEPSVDDLYRANTYKLVNGISELPKGGMKGAGTGAVSKNQEVDKEGNQVPLNRTGKEEEEYRRVTQEAQKKDEQKGWFKKMHEAVQRNQEGEEGITKPTKELKTGQVTRGKLTYEQRRQQQGELRTKQREEMETIRNGAPAREAGRAPLSYPVDETGYVPPRNAPPRRIPANLQDSDVPIINNVVRAKLSRMLLRAGLPSHVTNKETGKSGKFMPEETIKDIVGKVQQSLIKDGLDMKAGRVPTSNAVSGIERRGADIEHPDAVAKTDMVAQSAGRRAQEFFKEWLEEQKTLKKTSSLDQSAGEGRTQHDVLAGAQHAEGNETAELEQKTTHKENPIEEIPSKINEKFDTTNGELAGMLEGMQERFGDDRFSEHIAKLDAMPEGTQLDSKSWIEKNIPKEDLRHQDKEEGIQSKEIFTTKAQQLIKNPKSGQLNSGKAFNGNQLLGVLKNNLSPVEWDILQKAGIEKEFGGGRNVSQQDASQWVQEHTPKVEVHTYGMEGKVSEAKREYDRMTHEWYDNEPVSVRTKIDEAITRPNSNQLLHDYISNGARRSGGNLWTLRQTPEWKAKAERYLELAKQVGMEDTSGGPKATSYYSTVSAFDTTQPMPEWTTTKSGRNVQRVDVVIPLKGELSANDVRSAHKLGGWKETQDKGLMWPPDDLHENLPNTLGWAMIQYKTGPKGEKIAVIAEAQSRWGQERRKLEQDAKDNNRVGVLQTLGGKDAVENHSLLRDYNRLILKAAIEQARKEGATHIMVSDAETAMMTERHDAQGYEINRYQDKNGKIHESREGPNTQYGHYLLSQGMKWVEKTHSPINQEPGMRLNYDTILPKIAEELTGSKGEKVSLGEHKNAYETKVIRERQRPDTGGEMPEVTDQVERSNLIFRNADGTPKTSVTGRMYPLEAVGHKLDSGDSFTLFNKHQDKEEGITPEQKFNFLHLMPAIDKARHLSGPEGKPVADVFQKFPTIRDEFYGKYSNKLLTLADKMPVADRNYVHNWLMKEDLDQKSYASMMNSPAKKALYEATREALKQKQLDQIKDGQQVRDFDAKGKPFMRDAQVNPFYYPSVLRPDVLDAILNHTGDYKRYQNMLLEHWGGVNNPNAIAKLESLKAAGDSSKPNATRFGANRLTEGAGLPAELRVKDYGKTISKYFNKVATDRAWFNLVEKNPEVNKAIQPDNSQGVYHEFKNIIEQIKGEPFDHDAGVIRAFNKVFTSALLGPMTNIHIGWSTIFNPFQYLKATELATAYPKALANWGEAAEKIYQNGYKRRDLNSLADITDSQSTFINRMQAISSLIGKVNGREWTDRVSKTFAQALGEQIVPLRIEGAKQGDKWSQKMIMQLDPSWSKDKVYSKEEIASMASSLGGLIHGAHDYRTLPEFMTRESIIKPFLSLQSWSVSQTNQWMKHVWEPATQGNIQPLLMSTLGAAVGGYVIQQLRQQMMDKKSNIPSLTEIAKSSKGLEGNIPLLAYNFMQMASFTGMMGIGSSLGKMAFDTAYKNIPQSATFPLDEAVTNIGKTITEAVSAFQQNPTADNFLKIFPQAMIDLAKENVQTARIADNWMSDKGVSTQTENYKYKLNTSEQDLRRFKMAEGMPYDQQTETSNNPYLNMEQKNFKRTTDIGEAAKEVPDLVALAQERAAGNPEILKNQLNTLKQNSYQTMPSPENMPLQYAKYYQYLVKTIGPEAAQQRVADYMRQNTINKMKESMIPSMR